MTTDIFVPLKQKPVTKEVNDVVQAITELRTNESDLKTYARHIVIRGAFLLSPVEGKPVILICAPYRTYMDYIRPVQGRLIAELEKKLKKFVLFYAQRQIIPKNRIARGTKKRLRSRTLKCVYESVLEDLVAPTDIVGKRTRVRMDGKRILRVQLDSKARTTPDDVEEKLGAFALAYQRLTRHQAIFHLTEP